MIYKRSIHKKVVKETLECQAWTGKSGPPFMAVLMGAPEKINLMKKERKMSNHYWSNMAFG